MFSKGDTGMMNKIHNLLRPSRRVIFHILVAALMSGRSSMAFHLVMDGSSIGQGKGPTIPNIPPPPIPGVQPLDVSSGLISQLAVAALRARLTAQTSVKCEVSARNNGLLAGSFFVGPATVKGRGWQSSLGLTCRAIEATVDVCELSKSQIVAERKLVLVEPALGSAMIALDKNDFSNFLAHPLLSAPIISVSGVTDDKLQFLREDVTIDPSTQSVSFLVSFAGKRWRCALRRSKNVESRATVDVLPEESDEEDASVQQVLGKNLSDYFNNIEFELDGTTLTFSDMMITSKGASPSIMLKMGITVVKFPSRRLAF